MDELMLDHIYTRDDDHFFFRLLEKSGFQPEVDPVTHPGNLVCRFIKFKSKSFSHLFYLEFVSGCQSEAELKTGMSFRCDQKLEGLYNNLVKRSIDAEYEHRNYKWQENSKDILPGWNFLAFRHDINKSIYTWITEYEPHDPPRPAPPIPLHPNGVFDFLGVELELDDSGIHFFTDILPVLHNPLLLKFERAEQSKVKNIVFQASSLNYFSETNQDVIFCTWNNKKAVKVSDPKVDWNLVIVGCD